MIKFDFDKNCYGCRNCENVCPNNAINMIENQEGFLVPNINKERCINCGLCDNMCPYINFKEKNNLKKNIWYSTYLKDISERKKSTSGGIFPALANYFLENNGLVCGCIWDNEMKAIHILTDNKKDIEKMRGSKYLQSDINSVAKEIKKEIDKRKILFVGTPCQIAAIKLYIGDHNNLFTCGLICEGVGSYKIWKKYVDILEKKYNSKMINASFRNKQVGWDCPVARYEFENNKQRTTLSYEFDLYVRGYLQALYYRNSCNTCQYKANGHNSDILIGDLWGATKSQLIESKYTGISALILNTNKGEQLFKEVENQFEYSPIDSEEVIKYNPMLMKSKEKNMKREVFFEQIDCMNIIDNINRNTKTNIILRYIKEILYKCGVYRYIKDLKK